jgi:hypothetical protein
MSHKKRYEYGLIVVLLTCATILKVCSLVMLCSVYLHHKQTLQLAHTQQGQKHGIACNEHHEITRHEQPIAPATATLII